MKYYIVKKYEYSKKNVIMLRKDNWDDYGFKTTFEAMYIDQSGNARELGSIKIAKQGVEGNIVIADLLPQSFDRLSEEYYSLWQSADAYELVKEIADDTNINIFDELNDIAYNLDLLQRFQNDSILQKSLLRYLSQSVCQKQFHRITKGEAKLTRYNFSYKFNNDVDLVKLDFDVVPDSYPPTNIHALIGGNGVGKTSLIKNMIDSIFDETNNEKRGIFEYNGLENEDLSEQFSSVICVGFSPFDDYSYVKKYSTNKTFFSFIGTNKEYDVAGFEEKNHAMSLLNDIEHQFIQSFRACLTNSTKRNDLNEIFKLLENDPMFFQYRLSDLIVSNNLTVDYNKMAPYAKIFRKMSSGHKVVLSIIVRCIDKLVEKTILFLDEPENHLHPPLLSSLIRSISKMLIKRNGVAIISTHSPIVLQEIPKSCVWLLYRNGTFLDCQRPRYETFGENIGTLTNEIFKYEINKSGFHAMLRQSVKELLNYEDVLEKFDNQLGDEAKTLTRILFAQKERGEL